jgi:hypothetical protein
MKNTIKIVGTVAAAVGFVSLAGSIIYKASVHEQICRSYEQQLVTGGEKGANMLTEMIGMSATIKQNPFAVFGFLGQLGPLMQRAVDFKSQMNNTLYAYVGTCGELRRSEWVNRPEVKSLFERIQTQGAELQKVTHQ